MEMTLDLPRCDESARGSGGCACGCGGQVDLTSGIASLPWWVWVVALGLFAAVSGNEEIKAMTFGARGQRRGRRR